MNTIKKILFVTLALPLGLAGSGMLFNSCTEIESTMVEFEEDNKINTPYDTVYSVIGIINKMQYLADRTILLGDIRGDMVTTTEHATTELKQLANFTADIDNKYNSPKDYFAVIQNCNFFISRADSLLKRRGEKIFEKEITAVRGFRAWTYLQFALNYGTVPFVTEPILKEKDADPSLYPQYGIQDVCNYFIDDLKPYTETKLPEYQGWDKKTFFPIKVILGDLCLWAGRYQEAATYYHSFLTNNGIDDENKTYPSYNTESLCEWADKEFDGLSGSYAFISAGNINMSTTKFNGVVSDLSNIFESTDENYYYYEATYSKAAIELSKSQTYIMKYFDETVQDYDTITPPMEKLKQFDESYWGDLRIWRDFTKSYTNSTNEKYSRYTQSTMKFMTSYVSVYRISQIYLKYAEALNLAGYPQSAFAILKYGLCDDNYGDYLYVDDEERERAGDLIKFSPNIFTKNNTMGYHACGCGDVECDTTYIIPELATREDSIAFVEQKILDEMALECSCEGTRFYDLMRYALRHNDNEFLANKVARRDGELNEDLYQRLLERKNWYLPLP